jgi:transposase
MTKVNQLGFTGTTIYCGLDVHTLNWRVNIRDAELELKDFTQPADANLLHRHLIKN